jgi:class 3 adenylate cyclase
MRPSKDLRDLMLGLYHDWSMGEPSFIDRVTSDRPEALLIGTDPREWLVGGPAIRALWRRQFEEGTGDKIWSPGELQAFEEGSVGWVADNPTTTDRSSGDVRSWRVTGVFHREAGRWKTVQFHASEGVPNMSELTTSIEAVAEAVERAKPGLESLIAFRGTVTIMFTDIESSTALNEKLGDDAWVELVRRHNQLVSRTAEAAGGTVVKSQGDGYMLAFSSARGGLECAIGIQRGLADMDTTDAVVRVRIGLHVGEPVHEGDDFFGRDVALAARIANAARGGEILVSSLARSLLDPSRSFVFEGPRLLDFKGFDGSQQIYSVRWNADGNCSGQPAADRASRRLG